METTLILTAVATFILTALVFQLLHLAKRKTVQYQVDSLQKRELHLNELLTSKSHELVNVNNHNLHLEKQRVALSTELKTVEHQLATMKKNEERQSVQFENIANRILNVQAQSFQVKQSKDLQTILQPLQQKIREFEGKVEAANQQAIKQHTSLKEQIHFLSQQNKQVSEEANNLAKALKGDYKKQGNWGEMILEMILEKSGLEKDREYYIQETFRMTDGKQMRPDVVIHLPKGKRLIIDSKVSLVAYEAMCSSESKEELRGHQKSHAFSIKKHVDDLASKNYHDLYKIESPDFVLLFIPIDPACSAALQYDPKLYEYAFGKNIIIVSSSTLLATLKTVETLWRTDKQSRYALKIAEEAGKMYDKLSGFVQDMNKLGLQISTVQKTYEMSMKKLSEGSGNVLKKAELVKSLGAKANKSLISRSA